MVDDLEEKLRSIALGKSKASNPQVVAIIFSLKGNRPEKYRDNHSVDLKTEGNIPVKVIEVVKDYGTSEAAPVP
ncbi:MAG: hypothetical protein JRE40_00935 [Deltaproteobacteria bacterium]|nr:hypothetical protein [Deltaproteobacteria bacterium]